MIQRHLAVGLFLSVAITLMTGCEQAPAFKYADGTGYDKGHWQDRWLVINYWAEWCGPCRHEIPELNELHAAGENQNLLVLGVNYDGVKPPKLNDVIARMQIEFPVVLEDPRDDYGYERPGQLPVTVLVTPVGEVYEILVGPQTAASISASIASADAVANSAGG